MIRQITISETIETGDYDDITNLCKAVQENMDTARWVIGDAALSINKRYGKDAIGEFAKDIQVAKATVQDYRNMSAYWTLEYREYVAVHFAVNWSILKVAKRFKDIEESIDFLHRCASEEGITTVDDYARQAGDELGTPSKAKKLARIRVYLVVNEDFEDDGFRFDYSTLPDDIKEKLKPGRDYVIDVYSEDTDDMGEGGQDE